jgi:demethoxyubiquinone hydroxylase (CLK1/Coq7/Cat5 family)
MVFFWESGLTYAQLEKWYVEDAKERALGDLKSTMERVRRTGSSSRIHENLESAIRVNCAGENGAQVDYQTCLDTFLSLEK